MNPYEILSVRRDASAADIKAAYRRMSNRRHPDRVGGDGKAMADVNRAYEILGDPEKRKRYDETGSTDQLPPLETRARAIAIEVLNKVIEEAQDHVNFIVTAISVVDQVHAKGAYELANARGKLERIQKRRDRIKGPAERNLAAMIFDEKIGKLTQQIASIEAERSALEKAREILSEYSDAQPVTVLGGYVVA